MMLILQNTISNEFLPGCEFTAVKVDVVLIGQLGRRMQAFHRMQVEDESLWQHRFLDFRPTCFNSFTGLNDAVTGHAGRPFEEWIEESEGWVLVDQLVVPGDRIVSTDCHQMTITDGDDDALFGWVYQLKDTSEIIRTAEISLRRMGDRLGDLPGDRELFAAIQDALAVELSMPP